MHRTLFLCLVLWNVSAFAAWWDDEVLRVVTHPTDATKKVYVYVDRLQKDQEVNGPRIVMHIIPGHTRIEPGEAIEVSYYKLWAIHTLPLSVLARNIRMTFLGVPPYEFFCRGVFLRAEDSLAKTKATLDVLFTAIGGLPCDILPLHVQTVVGEYLEERTRFPKDFFRTKPAVPYRTKFILGVVTAPVSPPEDTLKNTTAFTFQVGKGPVTPVATESNAIDSLDTFVAKWGQDHIAKKQTDLYKMD